MGATPDQSCIESQLKSTRESPMMRLGPFTRWFCVNYIQLEFALDGQRFTHLQRNSQGGVGVGVWVGFVPATRNWIWIRLRIRIQIQIGMEWKCVTGLCCVFYTRFIIEPIRGLVRAGGEVVGCSRAAGQPGNQAGYVIDSVQAKAASVFGQWAQVFVRLYGKQFA